MANKLTVEIAKANWESLIADEQRLRSEYKGLFTSPYSCEKYYKSNRKSHRSGKEYSTWYFIGWSKAEHVNSDFFESIKTFKGETYIIFKADMDGSVDRLHLRKEVIDFLLNGIKAENYR